MIRVYRLTTKTQCYYGMEVSSHADIITKHKMYKFNITLVKELPLGYELEILKECKSLKTAEELLKFYDTTKCTSSEIPVL